MNMRPKDSLPLDDFHLLVTRPQAQAQQWSQQLKALGADVCLQPMMIIKPVSDPLAQQEVMNTILAFDKYQKVIFISQNAVHYGFEWLDQYWPQLPAGIEFFAIGSATASLLNHYVDKMAGPVAVTAAQAAMNSEALLQASGLQHIHDENILIFRGVGGRHYLSEQLGRRGARVDYCELYQRSAPNDKNQALNKALRESKKQVVTVVHSTETLDNLCSTICTDDLLWLQQRPILLPGNRVADHAQKNGFHQCIVAINATHESMIEALYQWK